MNVHKLVAWYESLSSWPRTLVAALAAAIPFYFAAFLGNSVAGAVQLGRGYGLAIHAAVFIVLLTVIVFLGRLVQGYREQLRDRRERQNAALLHAHVLTDRTVVAATRRLRTWNGDAASFVCSYVTAVDAIQGLVNAAYAAFEANFSSIAGSDDRIDFELTFMTKSYQDGLITIPVAANRDGRAPRSMVLRKTNANIYDDTVTASTYRSQRPAPIIVEDTANEEAHYTELYPGQKQRIRSSIIFPVLDDSNQLLGTLVAHCDRPGFFSCQDQKFWFDLMEVFAKRIALEKLKMDRLMEVFEGGGALELPSHEKFF